MCVKYRDYECVRIHKANSFTLYRPVQRSPPKLHRQEVPRCQHRSTAVADGQTNLRGVVTSLALAFLPSPEARRFFFHLQNYRLST